MWEPDYQHCYKRLGRLSTEEIEFCLNHGFFILRLLEEPNITSDHILQLVTHEDYIMRHWVAISPLTSVDHLLVLTKDRHPSVRMGAYRNPVLLNKHVVWGLKDPHKKVRKIVRRRLGILADMYLLAMEEGIA